VELGQSYLGKDASQTLITFNSFIDDYLLHPCPEQVAYLAQHELFAQVPELRRDIVIPEYCAMLTAEDEGCDEVILNSWIGPVGTVSPLHNDPYHNLLVQVVGR
jgi:[protein]-arginine 3-hydroxylase / protease